MIDGQCVCAAKVAPKSAIAEWDLSLIYNLSEDVRMNLSRATVLCEAAGNTKLKLFRTVGMEIVRNKNCRNFSPRVCIIFIEVG